MEMCRTGGYGEKSATFLYTTLTRKIFGSTNDVDVNFADDVLQEKHGQWHLRCLV